jgi:hypothetical protein
MAKYQKVQNCGPVPYPDRSGKFLLDGETAEGDDWEPLVALGFIVKVEEAAAPAKAPAPKIEEPKAATLKEEAAEGANDGEVQRNDGGRTEEVDPPPAGPASDEGVSGRTATRRRR